jgi:hypothetical protein
MVDWDLAVSVGSRLAGRARITPEDAAAVVAELRADADRSTGLVREFTGLVAGERTAPVLVVDRPGWVQANADGFATILGPVLDKLSEKKGSPTGLALAVGSRVTGAEVGALLGFLAGKVLGQFDPFFDPSGRLLLVAPNIVHVERELGADPHDFRLWVCLHEETHRVQFTAVPWMRDHLFGEMQALAGSLEPNHLLDDGFKRLVESLKGGGRAQPDRGARHARAAGDHRPGHRRACPCWRARRRCHGRRGPPGDPDRRGDPSQLRPSSQGRRHPRPGAAPATRPGRQDGAVPRRRPPSCDHVVWQGRDGGVQRRLGPPREPPQQDGDHRPVGLGVARPLNRS